MFSIVILAAGLGKRMQMADTPKVLAKLKGKPLIYYVLKTSLALNPDKIVLVVGHRKELVIEYVKNEFPNDNIVFSVQKQQLGTGDAAKSAESELKNYKGNVLILSGDVPLLQSNTLQDFISSHLKDSADVSVLSSFTQAPTGYGRIVRDASKQFLSIIEEKDADEETKKITEVNSGIYFLNSNLLFELLGSVSNSNNQNEYYLTDIVGISKARNLKVIASGANNFEEFQGINTQEQLAELEKTNII